VLSVLYSVANAINSRYETCNPPACVLSRRGEWEGRGQWAHQALVWQLSGATAAESAEHGPHPRQEEEGREGEGREGEGGGKWVREAVTAEGRGPASPQKGRATEGGRVGGTGGEVRG
jgi:hypothetical protein